MTINELKASLNIQTLNLNTCETVDGQVYKDKNGGEWLRHWENDTRVEVSISRETLAKVKAENPSTLSVQKEVREAALGSLTSYRIVCHKPAEETL